MQTSASTKNHKIFRFFPGLGSKIAPRSVRNMGGELVITFFAMACTLRRVTESQRKTKDLSCARGFTWSRPSKLARAPSESLGLSFALILCVSSHRTRHCRNTFTDTLYRGWSALLRVPLSSQNWCGRFRIYCTSTGTFFPQIVCCLFKIYQKGPSPLFATSVQKRAKIVKMLSHVKCFIRTNTMKRCRYATYFREKYINRVFASVFVVF